MWNHFLLKWSPSMKRGGMKEKSKICILCETISFLNEVQVWNVGEWKKSQRYAFYVKPYPSYMKSKYETWGNERKARKLKHKHMKGPRQTSVVLVTATVPTRVTTKVWAKTGHRHCEKHRFLLGCPALPACTDYYCSFTSRYCMVNEQIRSTEWDPLT